MPDVSMPAKDSAKAGQRIFFPYMLCLPLEKSLFRLSSFFLVPRVIPFKERGTSYFNRPSAAA